MIKGLSLDDGCGNGKESPKNNSIIGIDFSIFALRRYPNENKIIADMRALPFKCGTFSNVLFIHSLDHLISGDRQLAIKEGSRILKESGQMIIKVFSREDFRFKKGKEIEQGTFQRGNKIITHYFTEDEFEKYPFLRTVNFHKINYYINIESNRIKREEYIIILTKCKSEKYQ